MNNLQQLQDLLTRGQPAAALALAEGVTATEPNNADAWFLRAGAARALSQAEAADAAVRQALLIQPFHPAYHALQAELWLDQGRRADAEAALRRSLSARADFLPALSALGVLLMEDDRAREALPYLLRAAQMKPDSASHWNNLGVCHLTLQEHRHAESAFERAVLADPAYLTARYNLARALVQRGQDLAAAPHLAEILRQQPEDPEATYLTGVLCQRQGDFENALHFLKLAARAQPPKPTAINAFAEFVWEQGDLKAARELYAESRKADPQDVRASIGQRLSLPMTSMDAASVKNARNEFLVGLEVLHQELPTLSRAPRGKIEQGVQWTNFLLAYQGQDDRTAQRRYAEWLEAMLHAAAPELATAPVQGSGKRNRIGIISHHLYECTVGRYFESWLAGLDRNRFDVRIFSTNAARDSLTDRLMAFGQFHQLAGKGLFEIARHLRGEALDLLLYPELGLHPLLFPLAGMRLAPLQYAGWGHPVTTGLSTIDAFLSSGAIEPDGAQKHYSEKLVLLPGLGVELKPARTNATGDRSSYALPEHGRLYLVPQSVYKIHPDNDAIFADVLATDADAVLVFFATDRHRVANSILIQRLQKALELRGLSPQGRVRILPHTTHADFLRIASLCDVMLDTLHWSGGHTSLDAISVGLPIVTVSGEFMRGRQSAGMLQLMDCQGLIAVEPGQLAQLAVEVAKGTRAEWSQRILAAHDALFGQSTAVAALNRHLDEALNRLH